MDSDRGIIRTQEVIAIFFLYFAVAFIIHQPGFHAPMIYDSASLIAGREKQFARGLAETLGIVPARPVFVLSLYANYKLAGMDPYFFRVFNAVILGAAGAALALMFWLIVSIQELTDPRTRRRTRAVAAFLGLLFVVHPLQTLVVLYIWQREAILACFFYFSAVAAYVGVRSGRLSRKIPGFVLVASLFFAGLLSKENLLTFPLTLVLAELILFKQSLKGLAGRAVSLAAVALPPLSIYLFLTWGLHAADSSHSEGVVNRLLVYYKASGLTIFQVLLTESRVFFAYLFSIVAPFWRQPQLFDAQIVSVSPWNPSITIAACAGVVALVCLAIKYHRERPIEAFGVLFYVVALLPEALLIPQFLFMGYRPILPMAGILLIFGQVMLSLLTSLDNRRPVYRLSVVTSCLLLAALFTFQTFQQATRWNPLEFWRNEYSRLPGLTEQVEHAPYWDVVMSFGTELSRVGKLPEAIEVMSKDLGVIPELEPVMTSLAGAPEISATVAESRTRPSTGGFKIPTALLANFGQALKKLGRLEEAKSVFAISHNNLGMGFQEGGDMSRALEQYRLALELRPDFPEALYNLGSSLREIGDPAQSEENLRRAIALRPDYPQAIQSLGYTLIMSGKFSEAIENFRKVLVVDPGNADAHYALGLALAGQGEVEQAKAQFRAALDIKPGNAVVRRNLETLLRNTRP